MKVGAGVPSADAVKAAMAPLATVRLAGWPVMEGGRSLLEEWQARERNTPTATMANRRGLRRWDHPARTNSSILFS